MKQHQGTNDRQNNAADIRLLGKRVSSYRHVANPRLVKSIALMLFLTALVFVVWRISTAFILEDLPFLAIATVVGSFSFFKFISNPKRIVHLHQNGLILEGRNFVQSILWPEINEVYLIPVYLQSKTIWGVTIHAIDGRRIRLIGFEGLHLLGFRINEKICNRLLPKIQDIYRGGSCVRFGRKLAVSAHGLHVGQRSISWFDISDLELDEERGVRIKCVSNTTWSIRIPMGNIANVGLLAALLEWINETHNSPSSDAESQIEDSRSIGVAEQFGSEYDVNELVLNGFESEEIDDVINGSCSIEDLLDRGPRNRPRNPK